jgi:hydrogenase/urease accessory protein HupE
MAKEHKEYTVGFKTINAKLAVTKKHLNKIKKHVTKRDQKVIGAQVKAIDVILAACGRDRMSATYTGNSK